MKKIWKILAVGLLVSSGVAQAGTRDGGGGVGVRCPAAGGNAGTFELLDYQEARRSGLHINEYPESQSKAIALTSTLFANHMYIPHTFDRSDFVKYISQQIVTPLFNGQNISDDRGNPVTVEFVSSLPLAGDVGHYDINEGCALEQIAYFVDSTHTLKIVRSRWEELDWLGKSMLAAHELVYLFNRQEALETVGIPAGQITSESTRRFVGQLFSVNGITPRYDGVPEQDFLLCADSAGDTGYDTTVTFYAYDSGDKEATVVFSLLGARSSLYQVSTKVKGTDIRSWLGQQNGKELDLPLEFVGEPNAPQINVKVRKRNGWFEVTAFGKTVKAGCEGK